MCIQIHKKQELIENFLNGHGQKWCGQSGYGTRKLTLSQEWTDGINWFFCRQVQIHENQKSIEVFWLGMVRNGCGQSGHWTLKLIISEEWPDGNWFFFMLKIFLGGHGQKWVWPVWLRDSKIDCISRMNRWNKLIFCMQVQIQES